MNPLQLQRLVDAAEKLLDPDRIVVMGSSAFLGNFPEAASIPQIETSRDVDLLVSPSTEENARIAFEALGQGRTFSKKFGVHADILRPEAAESLPRGWEDRLVPLNRSGIIFCLDSYDVGIAKLRAGRAKDLSLLSELINFQYLDWNVLEKRLRQTLMEEKEIVKTHQRLLSLKNKSDDDGKAMCKDELKGDQG